MDDFGRELEQSVREVLAFLDGKLALQAHFYVRPRDVREACGFTPSQMAQRLGMDLAVYLAWEGGMVRLRSEVTFHEQRSEASPAELLRQLVEAVNAESPGG